MDRASMIFRGPWGTYMHIPKCGGNAVKIHLKNLYGVVVEEEYPTDIIPHSEYENRWCVVRNPLDWLRSFWKYTMRHGNGWPTIPEQVRCLMPGHGGRNFPDFIRQTKENTVGSVFGVYCVPGVEVFRLEDLRPILARLGNMDMEYIHVSENKPEIEPWMYEWVYNLEKDTYRKYGYS